MSTIDNLPSEIINLILSHLHEEYDRETLRAFALASRFWLVLLRPILFRTTTIPALIEYPQPEQAQQMILSYVENLHLDWSPRYGRPAYYAWYPGEQAILRTLCVVAPYLARSKRFSSLSILLHSAGVMEWTDLERTIFPELENPVLKVLRDRVTSLSLNIERLHTGVGASLFYFFPNVTSLQCKTGSGAQLKEQHYLPLSFAFMPKLSSISWSRGYILEMYPSLTCSPTCETLRSLNIEPGTSEDLWRAVEVILPCLTALIELRLSFYLCRCKSFLMNDSSTLLQILDQHHTSLDNLLTKLLIRSASSENQTS
jgi:hypothetical protein